MAFNSPRTLSLTAQGVTTDGQPDGYLPKLERGVHLRWATSPSRGFPRSGYYLFRRSHAAERRPPRLLSAALRSRTTLEEGAFGSANQYHLDTNPRANFANELPVVDQYRLTELDDVISGSDGRMELRIGGQSHVRIGFEQPLFRVDIALAVKYTEEVEIRAQAGDVTIASKTATANGVTTLSGNGITRVQFELVSREKHPEDSATIVEMRLYRILDGIAEDWALVPGAPRPFTLPVAQSAYPKGPADIDAARMTAADRIEYGASDRYTGLAPTEPASGTVSATPGSAFIKGAGTDWTPGTAGRTIRLDGDDTAYIILEVLTTDRLVISRPYEGAHRSEVNYTVRQDRFETIHDMLSTVVSNPGDGGMADRPYPGIIHDAGTVDLENGSARVNGSATNWDTDFEGLTFRLARETTGSVDVTVGSPIVTGSNTEWKTSLEGDLFRLGDEQSLYLVESVDDNKLTLNRPYSGDGGANTYAIYERTTRRVDKVTNATTLTLTTPHIGANTVSRPYLLTARLQDIGSGGNVVAGAPATTLQYPMDSLLAGSLDPAVAQLLGMYWADDTVDGDSYDYLVVADHLDVVQTSANNWRIDLSTDDTLPAGFMQGLLNTAGASLGDGGGDSGDPTRGPIPDIPAPIPNQWGDVLDGAIVFNERRSNNAPLASPQLLQVFDLPGATTLSNDGTINTDTRPFRDTQAIAGLRWERPRSASGKLLPKQATMFYLWRYDHPSGLSLTRPQADQYKPIYTNGPYGTPDEFVEHVEPTFLAGRQSDAPDPPPDWPTFELAAVNAAAGGGWYSYAVSGVDIFGRHSGLSAPAPWYDYNPEARHNATDPRTAFAIELVDNTPPPPPTNIEARVIDGDDPYLLSDDRAWLKEQPEGTIGLYLRWEWPEPYRRQAPDLNRFEIRYRTGPVDTEGLNVGGISSLGGGRFLVMTDLSPGGSPNNFVGTVLRIYGQRYRVIDATRELASGLLQLIVAAPTDDEGNPIAPALGTARLTIPAVITDGMATLKRDIRIVDGTNTNWTAALEGQTFYPATDPVGYTIDEVISGTELRLTEPYEPPPAVTDGAPVAYRIPHPRATDLSDPDNWQGAPGRWVSIHGTALADEYVTPGIGDEPDVYELRLRAPGTGLGDDSFEPSQAKPVATAHIGIYAVDDRGNAGAVGAPGTVTNVHRERPPSPEMPVLQGEIDEATPADYHGKSFYTFRWKRPNEPLTSHVFRAMDESVFQVDFDRRSGGETLDPTDESLFPQELRGDGQRATREAISDELEAVWALSDRGDAVSAYRTLSPNAFRVLAGLPGNEGAFSQVTPKPIGREEYVNAPGPDDPDYGDSNPPGYPANLHAYTDKLDGQSSNWYVYRAGTVDPGYNRSDRPDLTQDGGAKRDLGFPGLPVAFPDTLPPRTPSVTAVEGGDREITIRWSPNREADLKEYRIYRSDSQEDARDIRLMDMVATVPPADPDPGTRPAERQWVDKPLHGMQSHQYRLVAVDAAGNVSKPSAPVGSAAYNYNPPSEPTWERAEWVKLDEQGTEHSWTDTGSSLSPAVALTFTCSEPDVTAVVQQKVDDDWRPVTGWLSEPEPDASEPVWRYQAYDMTASPDQNVTYRTILVSGAGVELVSNNEQTIPEP